MEIALASFGGIFLLLSLGLGALAQSKLFQPSQGLFVGDRIAAAVIGTGLIATALVLRIEAPTLPSLVSTFGVTVGVTGLYCVYLVVTRPR